MFGTNYVAKGSPISICFYDVVDNRTYTEHYDNDHNGAIDVKTPLQAVKYYLKLKFRPAQIKNMLLEPEKKADARYKRAMVISPDGRRPLQVHVTYYNVKGIIVRETFSLRIDPYFLPDIFGK